MTDIYILSAARTAIGSFGGSLAAVPPIDLATIAAKAAIARAGVEPAQIGTVVFGHVINTEPRDMYLAPRGRDAGGRAGHHAGDERQPAVRIGRAGDCLGRAGADAGRCRHRAWPAGRSA